MSLLENYNLQLFQSDIRKKMPLTCIVGLKTNEPFRETLKTYLDDISEYLFYKC